MKYAIVTFYESYNYGTVLQAYALQTKLAQLGYQTDILNIARDMYASNKIKEIPREYSLGARLLAKVNGKLTANKDTLKKIRFDKFRTDFMCVSKDTYENEQAFANLKTAYAGFICGSDQIWNPYHKVFSTRYLLDFADDDVLKISFASSFGVSEIESVPEYNRICRLLTRFDGVSVRESSGVQIVKKMGLPAPAQFLDPVFLLKKEEWLELIPEDDWYCREKYILIYALVEVPSFVKVVIRKYARKHKCRIKIIPNNYANLQNLCAKPFESGPIEFLSLIHNAYCVFTNSFHGAAFSILLNKPVYGFIGDSENARVRGARITDLFEAFGLENHILQSAEWDGKADLPIDYGPINKKIEENEKLAVQYLEKHLK